MYLAVVSSGEGVLGEDLLGVHRPLRLLRTITYLEIPPTTNPHTLHTRMRNRSLHQITQPVEHEIPLALQQSIQVLLGLRLEDEFHRGLSSTPLLPLPEISVHRRRGPP